MLPRDVKPQDAPVPCACCGAKAETEVWQLDVCWACFGDWRANHTKPPEADEWPRKVDGKALEALYEKHTAAWLERAKARRAA